jgi:catechol 2,3-dioxygenase-like lactoylglutathione lyase family enzyme
VRVTGLDHVVFVVSDVEASVRWYQDLLGCEVERLEQWRRGEVIFVSLRITPTTIIDLFPGGEEVPGTAEVRSSKQPASAASRGEPEAEQPRPMRSIDHVALVVEDADLEALAARTDLDVESGPSDLWGAQGNGRGVYVRDPDRNLVELRTYG